MNEEINSLPAADADVAAEKIEELRGHLEAAIKLGERYRERIQELETADADALKEKYQEGFTNGYNRGRDKEDYINNPTGQAADADAVRDALKSLLGNPAPGAMMPTDVFYAAWESHKVARDHARTVLGDAA